MSDELDFDEFYAASFRRVVSQVYAMTGSLAEAEDSVQEAFARAWERWNKIRDYGEPEAWVRTVAFRISVSSWRKASNRLKAHRHCEPDREVPDLTPDRIALVSALRKIPADQRRLIILHHMAGLTVNEITRETGTPSGTVKSKLVRGRNALAVLLGDTAAPPAATNQGATNSAPRA